MIEHRHTLQRQSILRLLKISVEPLTVVELWVRLRRALPTTTRMTVYRNLQFLLERGEIYQVESKDRIRRYIGHAYHQASFTCQRCGKQRSLPTKTHPAYVDRKMFGDQVVFVTSISATGLCATCAKKIHV